ncbi:MAG: PD-(D/E)XK nuclease family protein [Sulfurimonas sp.]|nr:PD-(D/E)XK nuclease family protein [Sulfurimonas sp.]
MQNLYITYSNQKARDLKNSSLTKPLDKIITLDNLVLELYEKKNFQIIIDEKIGSSLIYKIIHDNNIEYFSYLKNGADSLGIIYGFILKCRRNEIAFDTLHSGEKLEALEQIDSAYQEYKKANSLADKSDIEKTVLESWSDEFLKEYDTLHVDEFVVGNIDFVGSSIAKKILNKLSTCRAITPNKTDTTKPNLIKPKDEVFNSIDEVKTAIKIARKLLQDGEKAEDILIVASDIAEYAPIYRLFLDEYEMRGFCSVGTPLTHFYNSTNPKVKSALEDYEATIDGLQLLYNKLGLKLETNTKESIKASITLQEPKIGIELTEPNQIVGLSREYKHIIFIGTDINHFPPKATDNFLYSYEENIKYFHANNYFTSSKTQYEELKRVSKNLYIITARYSGKRELVPSIILDSTCKETIDISHIKSRSDLALEGATATKENWLKSNKIEVKNIEAKHLSASQINKYNTCPLAYLYSNKIRLQAPTQPQEGFDAMEQGSLMHLCYEFFGRYIKQNCITSTCRDELNDIMLKQSKLAYKDKQTTEPRGKPELKENIHHKIFLSTLQAGLNDDRPAELLAKFVGYYIKNAKEFDYFQNTEFEKEFALDNELKPCELKDKKDAGYFIKGFIDRFDNLPNHINIVDYKSKKVKRKDKKKQEEVDSLKDVQLALYILYASQQYLNKTFDAHMLSFKGNENGIKFVTQKSIDEVAVKKLVNDTKKKIESGDFSFNSSDEQMCEWCDVRYICHESVLSKSLKGAENG